MQDGGTLVWNPGANNTDFNIVGNLTVDLSGGTMTFGTDYYAGKLGSNGGVSTATWNVGGGTSTALWQVTTPGWLGRGNGTTAMVNALSTRTAFGKR